MKTICWKILTICLAMGTWTLGYLRRKPKQSSLNIDKESMMRVIANHTLLQHYFNHGNQISDVQILEVVYSPDHAGALAQVLCKRTSDGNATIRLYFVSTNGHQYTPHLLMESARSLDWGQRLVFYEELKPIKITLYSGRWAAAVYQQLALTSFDGITTNWKTEEKRIKFAITAKPPTDIVIIPIIPNSN